MTLTKTGFLCSFALVLSMLVGPATGLAGEHLLQGVFDYKGKKYEVSFAYQLAANQKASKQVVSYVPERENPETGGIIPDGCLLSLEFPATYQMKIVGLPNREPVYQNHGVEYFEGGAWEKPVNGSCGHWNVSRWQGNVHGWLRLDAGIYQKGIPMLIGGKSHRFVMDTYSIIAARGTAAGLVEAADARPNKWGDGVSDGQFWLDIPRGNGDQYDRIWLSLKLVR